MLEADTVGKSRGPKPAPICISQRERTILEDIVRRRQSPQYEVVRASIILEASLGKRNQQIADKLGIGRDMVRQWRKRWKGAAEQLRELGSAENDKDLRGFLRNLLDDAPRSGCPPKFTAEQICQIVAVACEAPADSGRPVDRWTPKELADEVMKRGIAPDISARSVGRFLKYRGSQTPQIPILAEQR